MFIYLFFIYFYFLYIFLIANIQNTFIIFKTRFKCFKRVANVFNILLMFQMRCEYSKHVSLTMLQTRCKYSKHVVNVSTGLYSQRVANSRKNINNNTRQVSATVRSVLIYARNCLLDWKDYIQPTAVAWDSWLVTKMALPVK